MVCANRGRIFCLGRLAPRAFARETDRRVGFTRSKDQWLRMLLQSILLLRLVLLLQLLFQRIRSCRSRRLPRASVASARGVNHDIRDSLQFLGGTLPFQSRCRLKPICTFCVCASTAIYARKNDLPSGQTPY